MHKLYLLLMTWGFHDATLSASHRGVLSWQTLRSTNTCIIHFNN